MPEKSLLLSLPSSSSFYWSFILKINMQCPKLKTVFHHLVLTRLI